MPDVDNFKEAFDVSLENTMAHQGRNEHDVAATYAIAAGLFAIAIAIRENTEAVGQLAT
jgi:hypothetical protein